jgi:mono/diheme cytochrome c family protein
MPGFAGALDDEQVAQLAIWLRANFSDEPPWHDVPKLVRESREMTRAQYALPPGGAGTDPLEAKAP